jgi:hypothetical protein
MKCAMCHIDLKLQTPNVLLSIDEGCGKGIL